MAPVHLSEVELRELLARVAGVTRELANELEGLQDGDWPLPDWIEKAIKERNALAATLKELPEDVRGKARMLYRAKLARARGSERSLSLPKIIEESETALREVLEELRRASLRDRALSDELHEHGFGGGVW